MDSIQVLSDEVRKMSIALGAMDKKLDLHIQKTEYEMSRLKDRHDMQAAVSEKHLLRLEELKTIFQDHAKTDEQMFKEIMSPMEWAKGLLKIAGIVSLISGAMITVLKLKNMI